MAKIEGDQNIPATWLDSYRATLTEKLPDGTARKRYPFRIPLRQKDGYKVSTKQKEHRARWLAIREKFKDAPWAIRQRWYEARPQWASLLWYYNYFMMSGLVGNAVVNDKGGGVIKDINHYNFTLASGENPEATISVDTCDPTKTICFFYGAGWREVLSGVVAVMYPFQKSLSSTQLIAQVSPGLGETTVFGVSIIEYI